MYPPFVFDIRRANRRKQPGVFVGLRTIAWYCGVGTRTIWKWYRQHGFPLTVAPDGQRWMTTAALIDEWVLARVQASQNPSLKKER